MNGLVAAYGFEEATGTQTTIDASGSGNLGTISGATRITTTQFGKALSFNGTNNWVTINDSASVDLTTGMTLEAWVYPTSLNGWKTVLMKEQTGFASYWLYANDDASRPANVVNVGGTLRQLSAGSHLPTNTWTHLAATYDGSTQKLYVNGVLVGSRSQTGAIALSSGALRIGGNSLWGEYFTGYIDEVRIYNRALSQAEIASDSKIAVVGLVVSTSANRSNSVPLSGGSVSGNIYVSYALISPTAAAKPAKQVKFWLDDPKPSSPTGTPRLTETGSSFRLRWKQFRRNGPRVQYHRFEQGSSHHHRSSDIERRHCASLHHWNLQDSMMMCGPSDMVCRPDSRIRLARSDSRGGGRTSQFSGRVARNSHIRPHAANDVGANPNQDILP